MKSDTLRCVVERITYQNDENCYIVIKVKVKNYNDLITVVGNMAAINVGAVLTVDGFWKSDSKYGKQFNAVKWVESLPATIYAMEKYLGSGLIKGVGPKFARKLVEYFKEDTLEVIENTPDKLIEVEGIGVKRVSMIKKAWHEQKEIKNVMLFLQEYDVSTIHATKIYKTYGNESIKIVTENPYRLADDIFGIGFKTADKIAQKLGIDAESYIRCRSGVLFTLNELSNEGHCYSGFGQLIETAVALLDIEESKIVATVSNMIIEKDLISEDENKRIYLPPLYFSEVGVSKRIKSILQAPRLKKITDFKPDEKFNYAALQLQAIDCAIRTKVMVLTGGPGTGKTTTTLGIIQLFKKNNFDIVLAAPTGRAAKRMTETTGTEAKTIHRLLAYKPPQGYEKNEDNPLEGDVLIVDESSMLDIVLFYNLLKAIPLHMTLILVGDVDQLPSIGPGNVLRDIINSKSASVVTLDKIFRQASGSAIIRNAHRINKGEYLELKNAKNSDFFFIEQKENGLIPQTIVDLCLNRLPKYYKIDPIKDIQVLCPMQKAETGALNLNMVLQTALNKNPLSLKRGGTEYRLGDKVMQIKNNYQKEIYNGDLGIIHSIDAENRTLTAKFDDRLIDYELSDMGELSIAYATTIHKAQGSEYSFVIMPITMSHFVMLQRNLLYTAITRAKKLFVLIGDKKAIFYAIKNNKVIDRNTWLKNRLES